MAQLRTSGKPSAHLVGRAAVRFAEVVHGGRMGVPRKRTFRYCRSGIGPLAYQALQTDKYKVSVLGPAMPRFENSVQIQPVLRSESGVQCLIFVGSRVKSTIDRDPRPSKRSCVVVRKRITIRPLTKSRCAAQGCKSYRAGEQTERC